MCESEDNYNELNAEATRYHGIIMRPHHDIDLDSDYFKDFYKDLLNIVELSQYQDFITNNEEKMTLEEYRVYMKKKYLSNEESKKRLDELRYGTLYTKKIILRIE